MPVCLPRLLLTLILMVMPFQGVAAAIHGLTCAPDSAHAGTSAPGHSHEGHHGHAGHDHGTPHQHPAGDGSAEPAGHQCCHHVSSAAAPAILELAAADLPVYLSSLKLLETLFFPEQPQRPPRV